MCILCMNDHVVISFHPQLKYLLYISGMQSIRGIYRGTCMFEVRIEMKSGVRKIRQAFKAISNFD